MDNRLKQDMLIEDALKSQPLAPMPRSITMDVMARIQSVPAPRPFRVTWNDFVIALGLSFCISAMWFSVQNFPPLLLAQLRMQSILLYQGLLVNSHWLIPTLSFGLAAFFSALTIPYLSRNLIR